MTEAEWLASTDPTPMLVFLKGKTSDRKLRLFACGCCRRIWHLVADPRSHFGVEVAERFADSLASRAELEGARWEAGGAADELAERCDQDVVAAGGDLGEGYHPHEGCLDARSATDACHVALLAMLEDAILGRIPTFDDAAERAVRAVGHAVDPQPLKYFPTASPDRRSAEAQEKVAQVALLCDIFGTTFRPVAVDPSWLTSDVLTLANGIYQERAFDRMPILADALMDAGCDNDDILNHCRQPGEHVRGCWVVDLILGKS